MATLQFPNRFGQPTLPEDYAPLKDDDGPFAGIYYGESLRLPQAAVDLFLNIDRVRVVGSFAVDSTDVAIDAIVTRDDGRFQVSKVTTDDDSGDSAAMSVLIDTRTVYRSETLVIGHAVVTAIASVRETTGDEEVIDTEYQSVEPNDDATVLGYPVATPYLQFNPEQTTSNISLEVTPYVST